MNTARVLRTETIDNSWSSFAMLSDQRMLSSLGRNLRDAYEDVTASPQPSELLRLAAMIDEQLGRQAS